MRLQQPIKKLCDYNLHPWIAKQDILSNLNVYLNVICTIFLKVSTLNSANFRY